MRGWTRVALGELVQPVSTLNPTRTFAEREFRYIDLGAIDRDARRVTRATVVQGSRAPSRARQVLSAGDVLVSTVRPNLNAVARVEPSLDGAIGSTAFCVLRPAARLDGGYLFHWVSSTQFVQAMVRRATGANYPAVSDKIIRESSIPLPPLDEQRRIARVLDTADVLRDKRRVASDAYMRLRDALFQSVFGKRANRDAAVPLAALLADVDSGKSPVCAAHPAADGEWGVLKLGAISFGEYRPTENKALFPDKEPDERFEVRAGDVLMTRKNTLQLVGASVYVENTPPRMLLPDLMFRLKIADESRVEPRYLQAALSQPRLRAEIRRLAGGSAGSMPNVSKRRLGSIAICVPPIGLQRQFSRSLERIAEQRRHAGAHLAHLDELFASLQQRAFSGQL